MEVVFNGEIATVVRIRLVAVALKFAVTDCELVVLKTTFAVCGPGVMGEKTNAWVQLPPGVRTNAAVQVTVPFAGKADALPVSTYGGVASIAALFPTSVSSSVMGRLVRPMLVVPNALLFTETL